MGKKIQLPPLEQVIEIYNMNGKNAAKAATYLGLKDQGNSIRKLLKDNGFELNRRRYHIDENYFEVIDNEEKAYWLGFLAADGTIRLRHGGAEKKKRGSSIILKLAVKDEHHVKKFADIFGGESRITYHRDYTKTRKGAESYSDNCRVSINSNKLVDDIMDKNVIPRKSWTLVNPNIDDIYLPHYIRGYFDGNGSISFELMEGKNRDQVIKNFNVSIACASEDFKIWFVEYFNKNGSNFTIGPKYDCVCRNVKSAYRFFDILYKDATVYLERKHEKVKRFTEYYEEMRELLDSKFYV